ncbi:hypothetical protein K438DRAFT_1810088 [Mycena galopus ATCC 62051]|nr:hypothetical protein K438DRAFT_1810088 [Mycena galopus ATCC 62051]
MASLRPERKSFSSSSSRSPDPRPSTSNILRASSTDTIPDEPALHKSVLVTLKFSSLSFLDSVVKDDAARDPLYVIRTTGTSTRVMRNDPWDGLTKTAEIKWPKVIPTKGKAKETLGALIQMSDGRWQSADSILKPGTMLSAPSRFNIPNFSHSLKWKRMGSAYWCTTSSVKGPIATFHPAVEGVPPRIKVYETLHDKNDSSRPILVQNVTDVQDWMLVKKYEGKEAPPILPPLSSPSTDMFDLTPPQSAPASNSQWRKILYGEPIFPKRYPNLRSVSTTDLSAPLPTSSKQMAKILYGESIYPSLRSSPIASSWESDDDDGEDNDDDVQAYREQRGSGNSSLPSPQMPQTPRGDSPSSESIYYPTGQPPSHGYIDPSYYGEDVPPVPQIPAQYASSLPLPPTPVAESSSPLPSPLRPALRSQSTPPREVPAASFGRRPSEPLFLAASSSSASASASSSSSAPMAPLRFRLSGPSHAHNASSDLSRTNTRSSRRSSQYSQRSLPLPPVANPPPLPRPPLHKDPLGDWGGGYSWTSNGAGPLSEAPPPYMEADSPTSTPLESVDPRRPYHA